MAVTELVRISKEIDSIDAKIKEIAAAEQAVLRTEKLKLRIASTEGFYSELKVKMDAAVQRQMGQLDEKCDEVVAITRNIQSMSSESPTAHTFEEDSRIVISFCHLLTDFLRSDRIGRCPEMTLPVEHAVRRLANNPPSS